MPMNDDAVLIPSTGIVCTAPTGTEPPMSLDGVDEDHPPEGYALLGHTSLDDLPAFTIDGGDTDTKGTWQNKAFRVVQTKAATPSFKIVALQFDNENLQRYFGTDVDTSKAGRLDIRSIGTIRKEEALLVVFTDGLTHVAFWSPKASFGRDDDWNVANDDFMGLPLAATLLNVSGKPILAAMAPWLGTPATPPAPSGLAASGGDSAAA